MKLVIRIISTATVFSLSYCQILPNRCGIPTPHRKPCGFHGIPEDYCWGSGCCYDDSSPGKTPWCYSGNTKRFIDDKVLTLLAIDGVPIDVILSLYSDATPGAEWMLAFRNQGLNTERLLKIIVGNSLNVPPLYAKVLAGENPLKIMLSDIAAASGMDSTFLQLALDGKTEILLKHLLYLLSARNINPGLPYGIIAELINGSPLDTSELIKYYAESLMPSGDKFRSQFFKGLLAGNTNEAIQWAYLSALQYQVPQRGLYPANVGVFSHIVRTQKNYPGKISPALILALAKGDILPGLQTDGKTFKQLFGVPAEAYICAAHSPNIQIACEKLKGKLYPTSKECYDAGCCLKEPELIGQDAICYENVLGSIGTFLAQSVIDEQYITDVVLGGSGSLPNIDNFIPWLPSTSLPTRYTNWLASGGSRLDLFIEKYPTVAPLGPSKLRPNFKWRPHGPTAFPFNPKLPGSLLVPTQSPGIVDPYPAPSTSDEGPLIAHLQLKGFGSSCRAVQNKHKVPCLPNSATLSTGGAQKCSHVGCCFIANYADLKVPSCFRPVSYGQCYKVDYSERQECGMPGIKRQKCLENPQCCYDAALPFKEQFSGVPWCYFKKRAPLLPKDRCSRVSTKVDCFPSATVNAIVAKSTCEKVGCCFDGSQPSAFDVAIGRKSYSPNCYKAASVDLTPTDAPPETSPTTTETKCKYMNELPPHLRVDCGNKSPFSCRVAGCCYEPAYSIPGAPWCFKQTTFTV